MPSIRQAKKVIIRLVKFTRVTSIIPSFTFSHSLYRCFILVLMIKFIFYLFNDLKISIEVYVRVTIVYEMEYIVLK